jgi:hypothetical protein
MTYFLRNTPGAPGGTGPVAAATGRQGVLKTSRSPTLRHRQRSSSATVNQFEGGAAGWAGERLCHFEYAGSALNGFHSQRLEPDRSRVGCECITRWDEFCLEGCPASVYALLVDKIDYP